MYCLQNIIEPLSGATCLTSSVTNRLYFIWSCFTTLYRWLLTGNCCAITVEGARVFPDLFKFCINHTNRETKVSEGMTDNHSGDLAVLLKGIK